MIIYVTKVAPGVYEPLVDFNGLLGIHIPSWNDTNILAAEEEGKLYREMSENVQLAHISEEALDELNNKLETFIKRVEDAKRVVENLNPYAEKQSTAQFMAANMAILNFSGDSFLGINGWTGELIPMDSERANELINEYKESLHEEEYEC